MNHAKRWLIMSCLAVFALSMLVACSNGPERVPADPFGASGAGQVSGGQFDGVTPLFETFESPAAEQVREPAVGGGPAVACDLRRRDRSIQADAYWQHFQPTIGADSLSGYEYTWLKPLDDGGIDEITQRLNEGHSGTSLLDTALPEGGVLRFRIVPA